jgi:hypothetical protein
MKLLSELRFLTVSTLVFMFISMTSVFYLYFFWDSKHHLGNNPGGSTNDSLNIDNYVLSDHKEDKGKILFKSNCARCHYITDQKMIGPGLKGIMDRITEEQFLNWVQDPAAIRKKDPYFKKLFKEYDESIMPSFPLKKEEIQSIIEYLKHGRLDTDVVAMR